LEQTTDEALGVGVAENNPVCQLKQDLGLLTGLGRTRKIETKIDDDLLGRLVNEISVTVTGA
jgi:hypothetical protein